MGRKPKLRAHQQREAIKRRESGKETLAEIGRSYNVSVGTKSSSEVDTVTAEASTMEIATAFLALQLRQAQGWLVTERATVLRRGQADWSYNFGFPAASLNDGPLRDRYQRCTAAALALAGEPVGIKLSTVRTALAATAYNADVQLEDAHAALIPEIAAAVSGFANSTRLDDGLYALVDVGGSTVDCCTFNLFKS
jgi:hypothetical protein